MRGFKFAIIKKRSLWEIFYPQIFFETGCKIKPVAGSDKSYHAQVE